MTKRTEIEKLQLKIREFGEKRSWQGYHSPKNLAMALSVETAELVEIFQWMETEESRKVDNATRDHIEHEIGDIMIYLINLANQFNINPINAARKKLKLNKKKYPVTDKQIFSRRNS